MQNIIKETLQAGETIRTGGARFLLMRDASNSITVQLDTREPVEIKKNDVVLIEGYTTVMFKNHHQTATTIEYQITDISINTQSDVKGISGSISVDAIADPIVVSAIQVPLTVQRIIDPLNVKVSIPNVEVSMPKSIHVGNLPVIQKVEVTNSPNESAPVLNPLSAIVIDGKKTIPANSNRKGLILIAPKSNTNTITVAGLIPIDAGGNASIPASNALTVTGTSGDVLNVGEVL